jgi:RNA polymerase sigma-70 factor (ECF subfamily)
MLSETVNTPAGQRLPSANDFETQALRHMQDLFRTAASILGNRTDAEDAVQEAYLQAWKSFQRFTPGTNCRAWLFGILFHVISHQRRKWTSRFVLREPKTFEDTMPYTSPVPENLTDQELLSVLRNLPQQFAEVVMLADVHEFSYKEIQQSLGIPIGTVMSRLSRGRQLLRAQLAHLAPARDLPSSHAGAFGAQLA